ncbi:MAG: type II toxin-antitoxin system VapC family toxin [Caulobacteraceae bacterium]|nr:type II toxin-antitoxin system VapC family toxin [Caulobacteraceae bacterium]
MIVADASALVEALLGSRGGLVTARLFAANEVVLAPHLIDLETTQAIRRILAGGGMDAWRAAQAIADLQQCPLVRHDHTVLLPRIWALRDNLTAYDATYVAIAEAYEAPLVTCDGKLAASPGHRARVEVL